MSHARQPGKLPSSVPPAVGVRAAYDAVARAYDEQLSNELDGKPLDRALLEGFLELTGAGTIADVGCGPGHVTRFLAARHPTVLGIDLSPGMIAVARERAPNLRLGGGFDARPASSRRRLGGSSSPLLDHPSQR